ncbi:hypothetical protein SO802_006245 [Lithocarpus litseifolius]|uniref:RNase H type-1 domain-containing protein n=1 Tax=Lithocarpus litseifolius TaxID=425828 RepID=A0AAW2DKC1_9ROSI
MNLLTPLATSDIDTTCQSQSSATFENEEKSGISVVIRDSSGQPIATLSQQIPQAYNAVEIEAIAATKALEFAREVRINNVVMEGDSWLVHHALVNDEKSLSPFGLLIEYVTFVSSCFSKLLYPHTKREGNKFLHGLSRHAIHISNYVV